MSGTPMVFRCGVCGRQYLGRRQCCDARCDPAPIRRGRVAESARPGQDVSISIILVGGPRLDRVRRAIAGLLKAPPPIPFELVLVASRLSEAMCRYLRHVARRENVRLLLVPPGARRSCWRAADRAARAAGGPLLVFARAGIRSYPPGVWGTIGTALADSRVGLAGMELAWRQVLAEPSPVPFDPRYRFSMVPLNDSLVAIRNEVFREVGGFRGTKVRGEAVLDLQYRIIRANYRLALAKVPAGSARLGRHRPDPRFAQHRYPVFSVAIATRNYGRWLPRCLNSVLRSANPTGAPVQIVVADDCSTDDTAAILAEYRRRFPRRISLVPIRASGGVAVAKNAAMRRCIGEYVALLDADDEFAPDKIARCHAELRARPGTELLTHDYTFINDDSGERSVTEGEWAGGWRPPGVWLFRNGLVRFNEQMVCGYEELEWTSRRWQAVRRRHIATPLAVVHGTSVRDRWKVDREVAGAQILTRWDPDPKDRRNATAFACRACGNQYLRRVPCCGRGTEAVPLVCYMVVASGPGAGSVAVSMIVFVGNDLSRTRKLVERVRREAGIPDVEWLFVHCHPRSRLVAHLREFATTAQVKAIFTPHRAPLVYGHDANRAARASVGKDLLFLSTDAPVTSGEVLAGVRERLGDPRTGLAGLPWGRKSASQHAACWGIRQEVFWELGGMDERCLVREEALRDLGRKAVRARYLPFIESRAYALSASRSRE